MRVVTIVAQRSEAVKRYIEDTGLPFNILVDEGREVLKAYGVWQRFALDGWNIARPALFLIDRDGRIRYTYIADSQEEFPDHGEISREIARITQERLTD